MKYILSTIVAVPLTFWFFSNRIEVIEPGTAYHPPITPSKGITIPPTLVKDSIIWEQIQITDSTITLYAHPDSVKKEIIINTENISRLIHNIYSTTLLDGTQLYQQEIIQDTLITTDSSKNRDPDTSLPLSGVKIALDPGHVAGNMEMAKTEGKFIEMDFSDKGKAKHIAFYEANLTLATCLLLQQKLEKQGASVFMTRKIPNLAANGDTYANWYKAHFYKSLDSAYQAGGFTKKEYDELRSLRTKNTLLSRKRIFHKLFKHIDNKIRAALINDFAPDLTLIVHYNVDASNKQWTRPTSQNLNMVFIPGAFSEGELDQPERRLEFLRLLLTDDIERCATFGKYIIKALQDSLQVPVPAGETLPEYLTKYSIKTEIDGVYSRNLALTRNVRGIVCYGESLYQDNREECLMLNEKTQSIQGIRYGNRVEQVANAYYGGILEYAKHELNHD